MVIFLSMRPGKSRRDARGGPSKLFANSSCTRVRLPFLSDRPVSGVRFGFREDPVQGALGDAERRCGLGPVTSALKESLPDEILCKRRLRFFKVGRAGGNESG